jgi:ribosomal protein L11 methyltransferase
VQPDEAEQARAVLLALFPAGFEEVEQRDGVALFAYTDGAGEELLRRKFGRISVVPVEEGWEERWKAFHRGTRIGALWVGPPWEPTPAGAVAVVVDPGLAFGTGGHASTRLCLELLLDLDRGSLADLGCGSGVIAIAAAKVGFAPVTAIDHDPQAIAATRRNAKVNGVAVETRRADLISAELPAAEVVVANLSAELVEALAPRLRADSVIASGYLERDEPRLDGFRHVLRGTADGWAADLYTRE